MTFTTPNLVAAFSIFVGALVVLHWYDRWEQPSARFWKKADYYWLGFTALSIISAVSAQRQSQAETKLAELRIAERRILDDLTFGAPKAKEAICSQVPPQEMKKPVDELAGKAAMCLHYTVVDDLMQEKKKANFGKAAGGQFAETHDVLFFHPPVGTTEADWDAPFEATRSIARKTYAEMQRVEAETHHTAVDNFLISLSPFMLAFALALRITKVTGELRIEREKSMQS